MTVATPTKITLEAYLTYDDGTHIRYELVDGVLVDMGTESTLNTLIAMYLAFTFADLGLPRYLMGIKHKIEVSSGYASARDPDLIVHTEESLLAIESRKEACLFLGEPNPMLVIEVASPGTESSDNYQRDYEQKPREYAQRGIAEYWIVDPERAWVRVGRLTDGAYQFVAFQGDEPILSPTLSNLTLSATQVLKAGR
ncbi:MAG: Uma2 family endonuclease [Synechococcales bacterium]|nr:Uma2 family endonuclease [Synechococcales bacterium]